MPYDLRREYLKFRCGSAAEVIQFLEDNKDVPSLFVEKAEDAKGWEQGKASPTIWTLPDPAAGGSRHL